MAWFLVQGYAMDGPRPDNTLPVPPTGGGAPQPPLGIWGGGNVPFPTPPINIPSPPLGIWGGGNVPMPSPPIYIPVPLPPDPEHPNVPTHPIYIPVYPSHPIVLPPEPPVQPGIPPETVARIKQVIEFLTGNLPENPNPHPEPNT